MEKIRTVQAPVFSLCVLKDFLLVASGGGGAKFAAKNKILSFKIHNNKGISEKIHEAELATEIPVFISGVEALDLFCTCANNFTLFYSLDPTTGIFTENYRLNVLDFADEDLFQCVCRIDPRGEYFASGSSTGNLKIYKITLDKNRIKSATIFKDAQVHAKSINDVIILNEKKIIITASSDGSCKIFELSSLKTLKKISFRERPTESMNYMMRGIYYDSISNVLYTHQSPKEGPTYLTKWNLNKNMDPVSSIKITNLVCTAIDYSNNYSVIGLADSKGNVYYIDPSNNMKIVKKIAGGENESMIKTIAFTNGNLITGAIDNNLQMHPVYGKGWISLRFLIKIILLCLVVYYIFLKNKK